MVRPSYVNEDLWNLATQPNDSPLVVLLKNGVRIPCDRKERTYASMTAPDPTNVSGLEVIVGGQANPIPWTEIAWLYFRDQRVVAPGEQAQIEGRLRPASPYAERWIDGYIAQTKDRAVSVSRFEAAGLGRVFRRDLLDQSFAVEEVRPQKLPLSKMGLSEFKAFEEMPIRAITYKDTFFVQHGQLTASLAFHEMVHVVQWQEAGPENFLVAYGLGLMAWGYDACPLEVMAYNLEAAFNGHNLPDATEAYIREQTRLILAKPFEQTVSAL
jgi:hypothetical protein